MDSSLDPLSSGIPSPCPDAEERSNALLRESRKPGDDYKLPRDRELRRQHGKRDQYREVPLETLEDWPTPDGDPAALVVGHAAAEELLAPTLSERERAVFVLRTINRLDHAEIGFVFGRSREWSVIKSGEALKKIRDWVDAEMVSLASGR